MMKIDNDKNKQHLVAYWLLFGAFCMLVQVVLGGITRITESGLSITEWNPIMGAIPPFDNFDWIVMFEKYQLTDQYKHLKNGMNLRDFKFIYFWEWAHRNWARFIGIAFIIPFVLFIYIKYLTTRQIKKYLWLFVLGLLQALMGWLMVRSGLKSGNVFVEHTFLSIHFILALLTILACLYFAVQILIPINKIIVHPTLYKWNFCLLILLFIQLLFGAFMAGLHAASSAATWPQINHEWLPNTAFAQSPWLSNFLYNKIMIHVVHRNLAYLLFVFVVIWFYKTRHIAIWGNKTIRCGLLALLFLQIVLGIFTLLVSPDYMLMRLPAILHQSIGIAIFIVVFIHHYTVRQKPYNF